MRRGFPRRIFFVGSVHLKVAVVSIGYCHSTPKILGPIDPVLPEHANRGTVGNSGGCFQSTFFVRSSKGQLS